MLLAIGCDHAGFDLKQALMPRLRALGHELIDVGAYDSGQPDDYPDFAEKLAAPLLGGEAERGLLICGSGVGVSVAANKIPGIRAGLCHDTYSAHQGVEHDDMNVLVLGSRVIGPELAYDLARTFLNSKFSGEERHQRRLEKIHDIESRYRSRENVR